MPRTPSVSPESERALRSRHGRALLTAHPKPDIAVNVDTMITIDAGETHFHETGAIAVADDTIAYARANRLGAPERATLKVSQVGSAVVQDVDLQGLPMSASRVGAVLTTNEGGVWCIFADRPDQLRLVEHLNRLADKPAPKADAPRPAADPAPSSHEDTWSAHSEPSALAFDARGLALQGTDARPSWIATALLDSAALDGAAFLRISSEALLLTYGSTEAPALSTIEIPWATLSRLHYRKAAGASSDWLELSGPLGHNKLTLTNAQFTQTTERPYPGHRPLDALAGAIGDAVALSAGGPKAAASWDTNGEVFSLQLPRRS